MNQNSENVDGHLIPGALLANRYKITRRIGGSGLRSIYLAEDLNLASRPVTVKELIGKFTFLTEPLITEESFKREVKLLARLDHPSILRIYRFFCDTERGRYYLVMKYIEGSDLATRQRLSDGRIDEVTVTKWAINICDALDYIHSQEPPIVCRNLTPASLMIDAHTNRAMLADFGIERFIAPMPESWRRFDITGYSTPEQFAGNFETRTDIYSLGAIMFHLFTGSDPDDNPLLIFDFTKNPKPRQLNPAITLEMEEIICKAVEFKPENRFASARAFGQQLKEHLHNLQK
jgi:serine/threonine-protein kinase